MLNSTEIVQAFRVPLQPAGAPVFAILPKKGPVSFYSQQKRAFNLVAALRLEGMIPPGTTVGVVGAGLAGVTASAAAHMLGCDVTLFEANEAKFHQQHGNRTRHIHPNISDWPHPESISPDTDLPFLNWTAKVCADVIDDIEEQWGALGIRLESPLKVNVLDCEEDGAHITSPKPYRYEKFQIVIITCGESTFATVRLRTAKTKGCLSRETALAMVFKLAKSAERHWRRLNGPDRLAEIIRGVRFRDGTPVHDAEDQAAA